MLIIRSFLESRRCLLRLEKRGVGAVPIPFCKNVKVMCSSLNQVCEAWFSKIFNIASVKDNSS